MSDNIGTTDNENEKSEIGTVIPPVIAPTPATQTPATKEGVFATVSNNAAALDVALSDAAPFVSQSNTTLDMVKAQAEAQGHTVDDVVAAGIAANSKAAPATELASVQSRLAQVENAMSGIITATGEVDPSAKSIGERLSDLEDVVGEVKASLAKFAPFVESVTTHVQRVEHYFENVLGGKV